MALSNEAILIRLRAIEEEVAALKRQLAVKPGKHRPPSLYGIWRGAQITDEDIEEAKRSLFKPVYDDSI